MNKQGGGGGGGVGTDCIFILKLTFGQNLFIS